MESGLITNNATIKKKGNNMKITTKRKAERILIETLFKLPNIARKLRYDMCKYEGKVTDYINREVPDTDKVLAVYPEYVYDKWGRHVILQCVTFK